MSLSEKLKKANKAERGLPCGIGKLLSIVSDEDKEALELIFSTKAGNGAVSNIKIHEIIRSEGHEIAFASIKINYLVLTYFLLDFHSYDEQKQYNFKLVNLKLFYITHFLMKLIYPSL